ncbi:Retrotransposable element Tf2 [Gossypium australe]|uniref:Retrotransposable element Tf2 n=1 Tax=Gossypium australe TaxID=47621 RepID=A0A5B6UL43_9ROSI|nr:Retrotransposable element Tf2 [Gossypium australe]
MYAITQAVAKWRQYLVGHRFSIITDQQSLKNLTNQVIRTPEQQKWLGELVGYDFEILYRLGKHNQAADTLYCISSASLFAISCPEFTVVTEVCATNQSHPELVALKKLVQSHPESLPGYTYKDGLLLFHGCLVIPSDSILRQQLLREFHSSPIGGHVDEGFLPPPCRSTSTLPILTLVFEDISMDFITGLPPLRAKTVTMEIVDRLSKYDHFIALPSNFSSETVASTFVSEFIHLHGFPSTNVTDRDPRFMREFWQELHRLQGTKLTISTPYHPQTDGQTEALNKMPRNVSPMLHCRYLTYLGCDATMG